MKDGQKIERIEYAKIALGVIGLAGIIAVAAVAPNMMSLLRFLPNDCERGRPYANRAKNARRAVKNLIAKGYVRMTYSNQCPSYRLTIEGQTMFARIRLKDLVIDRKKQWDRKWRILTFDIEEIRKSTRDMLRKTLAHLGLIRFHDSVWIFPHECEQVIELVRIGFRLQSRHVAYLKTERFPQDRRFIKHFKIKS